MGSKVHPCMQCGACCAFFRVSFSSYQRENFENWKVPLEYTQATPVKMQCPSTMANISTNFNTKTNINNNSNNNSRGISEAPQWIYSMNGTDKKHRPKCDLLRGKIGELATCQIYACRPTPCREFAASFVDGKKNLRCDEARKAHGLSPLTRSDWFEYFISL